MDSKTSIFRMERGFLMEKKNPNDERFKEEVKAWLMIQVIGQTGVNILNKKKLEKEMRDHLKAFSDAEKLPEFADYFIDSCLNSKSYRTAVFGAIPMSDAGAATRIAQDIDEITRVIPEKFSLEGEFEPLRKALLLAYTDKIENANKLLEDAGIRTD